ncbi:MAG: sigma-70 family RNA polymerase sigma factor [Planctomycetota bacterium]
MRRSQHLPHESTDDLARRHGDYLRRLAFALVHDEAAALDLAQETWRVALERGTAEVDEPRAWLGGIARRIAWRRHRDDARRVARERDAARHEAETDDESLDWGDTIQAALRRLDEPFRDTIVQRYLHDRKPREIARRSGISVETVKSRLKRGLAALRADLDRERDRRAWALGLIGAFDLPARVEPAAPLSSASSAGQAAATSTPAKVLVNAKLLLAVSAIAAGASIWTLTQSEGRARSTAVVKGPASESGPALATLASIDGVEADDRRTSPSSADTVPATSDAAFTLTLDVEMLDTFGDPLIGAEVQIAPPDHPFVVAGKADDDGRLALAWSSRVAAMDVDVAFVVGGADMGGVHRVTVASGSSRKIVLQQDPSEQRSFQLLAESGPNEAERSRPQRGQGLEPDGIAFELLPEVDRVTFGLRRQGAVLAGLGYGGSMLPSSGTFGEVVLSAVEGVVTDELGQPAPNYPVRVRRSGARWFRKEYTDRDGRYRAELAADAVDLVVGTGDARVEHAMELEPGETARWSPRVSRRRDLRVAYSRREGSDLLGLVVQVRREDGNTLWIGRAVTDEDGHATIFGCPADRVDVDVLAREEAALAKMTLRDVPTGELRPFLVDETVLLGTPVGMTPVDDARPTASATELIVFDESKRWGQRLPVPGTLGSRVTFRLPGDGHWLELATLGTGRTVIGPVHAIGEEPIELGSVALDPVGELAVAAPDDPAQKVLVHWIREDIDSLVAERTAEDLPEVFTVPPGRFRVTRTSGDGSVHEALVQVLAGQRTAAR